VSRRGRCIDTANDDEKEAGRHHLIVGAIGATDGRTSTVLHALHKPANTMMTVGTRLGELSGSVAIMTPAKPVKLHGEQRPVFSSANAQGTGALHATCAREVA